jgi:hypothetical protein
MRGLTSQYTKTAIFRHDDFTFPIVSFHFISSNVILGLVFSIDILALNETTTHIFTILRSICSDVYINASLNIQTSFFYFSIQLILIWLYHEWYTKNIFNQSNWHTSRWNWHFIKVNWHSANQLVKHKIWSWVIVVYWLKYLFDWQNVCLIGWYICLISWMSVWYQQLDIQLFQKFQSTI